MIEGVDTKVIQQKVKSRKVNQGCPFFQDFIYCKREPEIFWTIIPLENLCSKTVLSLMY